jgi:Putative adhesin
MIRQRTLFIVAAALAAATPSLAAVTKSAGVEENPRLAWLERFQESRQGPEQTERFAETYKVGNDPTLDLNHVAGDVRVTTGRGNEIRVEAIKRVRHRDREQGKRLLDLLRVEVSHVGNRVEVRTIYPRTSGRGMSVSVDYTVTVPAAAAVSLKTISGDVGVNGVRGEVRAETVSGDVEVIATPNLALAKAISGDVRARDIGAPSLTLSTVSGSVIATALKVRTLEAGSVSGDVQLSNLQVERLTAKTVNGDIDYDGTLARGGRYELNAHSGSVRLMLTNVTGFELDASTFSGSIRSDFPVTLRSAARDPNGDARGRRGSSTRAIRGTFGDASAFLSVRSFSGTVVITKK